MIFYRRNTIQITILLGLTVLFFTSCRSTIATEPLPTLMPTAAVLAVQPKSNPTNLPSATNPPVESQANSAIVPSLQEFKDYYQRNHDFEWHPRPNHSGITPWAGILNDSDGERKLMLWTPIGKSEVQEMFYSYYFPTTARLNTQQQKILYDEMIEIMSLSLPDWNGGKKWLVSSLDNHFSTGRESFEIQVNGKSVLLEIGPAYDYNDFTVIFSIY